MRPWISAMLAASLSAAHRCSTVKGHSTTCRTSRGAGSSLQLTMYGMDQYIVQYEQELGLPWKAPEAWMKVSYPFFHADRIKTPTLFMGGEKDFNVPIAGSEQMYQALKSQGVETQLVIYPGQFHGLTMPSYERDRLQRYVDWYGRHIEPAAATSARQQ